MAEKEKYKSKIGGQALIEGVMMKGVFNGAMACRLPTGEIDIEVWDIKNGKNLPWYKKVPFIRGIVNFVMSMIDGYRCLMKSAEKQMDFEEEESEPQSAFDKWVEEHLGEKMVGIISVISIVLSLGLCLVLFKYLPALITKPLSEHRILRTAVEGIIKIAVFVGYMWVTSFMKDIKRTYEYHGAEHKTIACLEGGEELTVENVKKYTRFHPRCGTSFIIITLIISIFVNCFVPTGLTTLQRTALQLVLLPLIMGGSYELIRIAGRYTNAFTKIISAPGIKLQHLTTREPDDSQIEVAIAAIKPCIPENTEDDLW